MTTSSNMADESSLPDSNYLRDIESTLNEWHDKHDSLQGTCRIPDPQEGQRTASLFMEKAQ